ncbi:MAG: type VI secretion system ATPase TssH [Planctomycetes bacterium]|nr:type VI secretion system ATPase TssH [Planctomycetota bacterium]
MDANLPALIARLTRHSKACLEAAAGRCLSLGHYEVTVEHALLTLVEAEGGDVRILLAEAGIDATALAHSLTRQLGMLRTASGQRAVFSPLVIEWIEQAWLSASLDHGDDAIRSGVLVATLVGKAARWCAGDYARLLQALPRDAMVRWSAALAASAESAPASAPATTPPCGDGALARFCMSYTARARAGSIDPVFGRDTEIRQVIDILSRRRKNNPICVGDPGVGKTAVVEGLALRIAQGDVPPALAGVELVGLDLGLLQAGASAKGEFESRLNAVLDAVRSSPTPIVLFIDEAHTLIGAGGTAGTGDAANLLKPALARGELRTIAATTWIEYKRHIERDPALARRFQVVKLDEPSIATTVTMLRGLRSHYEQAHGVFIRDDALVAAAELGSRYIAGRQHPDKGIDLIDTAAARVKVALASAPAALQDARRTIEDLERERASLLRDRTDGGSVPDARLDGLERELAAQRSVRDDIEQRWQRERVAAERVLRARAQVGAGAAQMQVMAVGGSTRVVDPLAEARRELTDLQGREPLVHVEVTPLVVSQVIADWTGIPVGGLVRDQAQALLTIEDALRSRIKGQDHVGEVIGSGIRAAKAGLTDPNAPMGVFLLVGPSGVGKTETALAIADELFGGERFMTTINMSEFQERHAVSRLIGSPPGYIGYGEGGVLTEAVRQRPYSVVLLDEVEKADPEVMNLFYQVFDKGTLADGEGRVIDFRNTVILLTSNLGSELIVEACQGSEPTIGDLTQLIRPTLVRHFKPALLARMTVVPYRPVVGHVLADIARLKLRRITERLDAIHGMTCQVDEGIIALIVARCSEVESGARHIDRIISAAVLPRISQVILERLATGSPPVSIRLQVDAAGAIACTVSERSP